VRQAVDQQVDPDRDQWHAGAMLIIAFDPGVHGALAAIDHNHRAVEPRVNVEIHDLPTVTVQGPKRKVSKVNARALNRLLAELLTRMDPIGPVQFVVEDVRHMAGADIGAFATGSLMHAKGVIEGVLGSWQYPVAFVDPKEWQADFGVRGNKDRSLVAARNLYPGMAGSLARKLDNNRAEALLIAHWALRHLAQPSGMPPGGARMPQDAFFSHG
jgi:hypothetical protein